MKIAILGRQPEISLAELVSLYGQAAQRFGDSTALLDVEDIDINQLGGTLKLAPVIQQLPTADWQTVRRQLGDILPQPPDQKFRLGLSAYGFKISPAELLATGLELKKDWGGKVRIVPPAAGTALGTAQILHNHLISEAGSEIVITTDGRSTFVGHTGQIQDIEAYSARDQARPERSAVVGMLPPKLAQILVNLAHPPAAGRILDPFCGTGVVLQEALLAGYAVLGSDNDFAMVEAAQKNLQWLGDKFSRWQVDKADATTADWPPPVDAIVTESYLGPPLVQPPKPQQLQKLQQESAALTKAWLTNVARQTATGISISFCLPAWRIKDNWHTVPVLDQIPALGYTFKQFLPLDQPLIYGRPGQLVGRQIVVLKKI